MAAALDGGPQKNAPAPNARHPQQISCPVITGVMAEESDVDEAPLPPTIRLHVSSPTTSLSNSFRNHPHPPPPPTPTQNKLMGHQAGVSSPEAHRSSAGGVCQRDTNISAQGELGTQAYIITVSSARFPPEDAQQNK